MIEQNNKKILEIVMKSSIIIFYFFKKRKSNVNKYLKLNIGTVLGSVTGYAPIEF